MRLRHHVCQLQTVTLLVRLSPLHRARQREEMKLFTSQKNLKLTSTVSAHGVLKVSGMRTDRDVGPEELVVPEKRAHVLHAALLLHAVTDVGLEPGAELNTQT